MVKQYTCLRTYERTRKELIKTKYQMFDGKTLPMSQEI